MAEIFRQKERLTAAKLNRLRAAGSGSGGGGGSGSVTSVDVSGGTTGLTASGGPVTDAGTITLAGTLAVANGGTGATTAAGARTELGVPATGAVTSSGLTMATNRLLGRTTASTGAVEEITVGSGLTLAGGSLSSTGGAGNIYDANWFNVRSYGATGDGTTDDTAAIQAAIDACAAFGGGTVYFPRGTYAVGGALQDTSRSNAQLRLPAIEYSSTAAEAITIEFRGEAPPPSVFSVTGTTPPSDNLSVLKGTLNTGSGTAPCMIGGWGPVASLGGFTNVLLVVRDLMVQMPANPVLTAIDASHIAQFDADHLVVHTGQWQIDSATVPTTSTSYGIRTPGLNNGAMTRLGVVNVAGFYNGFEVGEHCIGQNTTAWGCLRGYVFIEAYHASAFQRLQACHCVRGLLFSGGSHATHIQEYNIEHIGTGNYQTTYDVDDASNYARGSLNWYAVLGNVGPVETFTVNGAAYLRRENLSRQGAIYGLTDGATVTINCSLACAFSWTLAGNRTLANPTAPWDGQVINVHITQDGTGSRTWTLGSKFKFPGGSPALSTAANARDFMSCQYRASTDIWVCSLLKALS